MQPGRRLPAGEALRILVGLVHAPSVWQFDGGWGAAGYQGGMRNIVIEVYGSEGDVYEVAFTALSGKPLASCTCKAGSNGQFCKHRLALLAGDMGRLVDKSKAAEVKDVLGWAEFAPILGQVSRLHEIEAQIDELEKARSALKKAVGKALGGR